MLFNYAYKGSSTVDNSRLDATSMAFAPDLKREPTYFSGELAKSIEFREAVSALHDVVVSDLRLKIKDRTAYKEWAAAQEKLNWQEVAARRGKVFLVSDKAGIKQAGDAPFGTIEIPECERVIQPIVTVVPLQLLAYHVAVEKGTDVDQPRNLAKSVTVE